VDRKALPLLAQEQGTRKIRLALTKVRPPGQWQSPMTTECDEMKVAEPLIALEILGALKTAARPGPKSPTFQTRETRGTHTSARSVLR
jgi:hypothetical protein